jgi:23S rRNA (cytidine1920-2'-O)/16S rRNA (cytidine1409-2'-O)-methyltransferase
MSADAHNKRRLDVAVVERGLAATRARARDLIRRGLIELRGSVESKAATPVAEKDLVCIKEPAEAHRVSRGGAKLEAALDHFQFSVPGVTAIDVGASTGGFTEVLLARGATRVYAVDIGRGQLHADLARDPRVVPLGGRDARSLDRSLVPEVAGAVTADVSFISLTQALPAALDLAAPGAWLVALIKPQFESGREAIGKGGIVRDPAVQQRAVARVAEWIGVQPSWRVLGVIASPLKGGSGNQEFLLGALRAP